MSGAIAGVCQIVVGVSVVFVRTVLLRKCVGKPSSRRLKLSTVYGGLCIGGEGRGGGIQMYPAITVGFTTLTSVKSLGG